MAEEEACVRSEVVEVGGVDRRRLEGGVVEAVEGYDSWYFTVMIVKHSTGKMS